MNATLAHPTDCHNTDADVYLAPGTAFLGEAPCSMNAHVEIPGLGRTQVTGRGQTGLDAAHQLKAGVDALQALYAAQALLAPRQQRLASLLTCGLGKAAAKQDWGLVERLSKAAALVLKGAVESTDSPTVLAVRSQTHQPGWYEVTVDSWWCTCPDWEHHTRRGEPWLCKHGLAAALTQRLDAQEADAAMVAAA